MQVLALIKSSLVLLTGFVHGLLESASWPTLGLFPFHESVPPDAFESGYFAFRRTTFDIASLQDLGVQMPENPLNVCQVCGPTPGVKSCMQYFFSFNWEGESEATECSFHFCRPKPRA